MGLVGSCAGVWPLPKAWAFDDNKFCQKQGVDNRDSGGLKTAHEGFGLANLYARPGLWSAMSQGVASPGQPQFQASDPKEEKWQNMDVVLTRKIKGQRKHINSFNISSCLPPPNPPVGGAQ